jgi:hypothetical protein
MEQQTAKDIQKSIAALEKRNRQLTRSVSVLLAVCLITLVGCIALWASGIGSGGGDVEKILRVRGLVVVDNNGIERVWIGTPAPEPLVLGKRLPRGSSVSGIILFDEEGNERSGYGTTNGSSNVLFTLDSLSQQHVLFMAGPQGDPFLYLWDGNNSARISVGEETSNLELKKDGKVFYEIPEAELEKK